MCTDLDPGADASAARGLLLDEAKHFSVVHAELGIDVEHFFALVVLSGERLGSEALEERAHAEALQRLWFRVRT